MKHYEELLDLKCFTFKEAVELVGGNTNTAKSLLRQYTKKDYIRSVKRNLYVAISIETGATAASPYQIAAKITPTSFISHRSAFAYNGYVNQVSYEVNVSGQSQFKNFEFEGMNYVFNMSGLTEGVIETGGVFITDTERTIVDYIDDFDHVGGLEELLRGLDMIPYVSEEKLLHYLHLYDKAVLYQKTGYILEHFKLPLNLSDEFFNVCQNRIGNSVRYFTQSIAKERLAYNRAWGLMVPEDLLSISA